MANKPAVERSWDSMVRQTDPDFERKKRTETEYEFTRRKFTADRDKRFPYDQEDA